ncbi:glycoside hydrolase family 79 protein [Schizopora paradoxa]|uniref:Glycoside hydrolase family 79 protein n=1 Tax=Schizopora paradoxa TaxID=27342 RepID=A0A0H2SLV9_9AGAM|nr:glycoside hydrolase family 79 protein [Schizopora paradoxa]
MLLRRVLAIAIAIPGALSATSFSLQPSFNNDNLVFSNFFGVSIELSVINQLIGNDTSSIPPQIVNYFSNIRTQAGRPLRLRIGGNSMDSGTYDPTQQVMLTFPSAALTPDDQPTTFGPVLFDVLKSVGDKIGGAQMLIGLSLINFQISPQPQLAHDAEEKLGSYLDGLLLGNEPDLYASHGSRPSNWTQADYFNEFGNVTNSLVNSSFGDLLQNPLLGGPTICCSWNLIDLLNEGYDTDFGSHLKYLNLQHYPQDNCAGTHKFGLDYYVDHSQVVELGQWQIDGVNTAHADNKQILMGEFNSASCGGIEGISDTFAATMWAMDWVLQMASVGYTGAYIHTREAGVTYNLFNPPAANSSSTNWTTLPTYYSLIPISEALGASGGAFVTDLNLTDGNVNSTVAGYAIYDSTSQPYALALFNYADDGSEPASYSFQHPAGGQNVFVRYLTATNLTESVSISWGGKTLAGQGNGLFVNSGTAPDQQSSCAVQTGICTVGIPSPGFALVWLNTSAAVSESLPSATSTAPSSAQTSAKGGSVGSASRLFDTLPLAATTCMFAAVIALLGL